MWKKNFAKLYNKVYRLLCGSGLSKYQNVRKIHVFITQKVKSEFVDFYGLKLYLGKKDEENYSGGISYEDEYFDLLETEIKWGENVIDVGAKIGIYSLAFSKYVGLTGTVFSFEPTPDSFNILKKIRVQIILKILLLNKKQLLIKKVLKY